MSNPKNAAELRHGIRLNTIVVALGLLCSLISFSATNHTLLVITRVASIIVIAFALGGFITLGWLTKLQ